MNMIRSLGAFACVIALLAAASSSAQIPGLTQAVLREQASTGTVTLSASSTDCSTAGSCATLKTAGAATFAVNLVFAGTATAQFEGSIDNGTTFVSVKAVPLAGGAAVTSATASGQWQVSASGLRQFRVRLSAFTNNVTAWVNASPGHGPGSGTLSSSSQLPSALGQTTMANSVSTAPASDAVYAIAATGGNPCMSPGATLVTINGATSGTTDVQIIAASGTKKIYICSMTVIGVSGSATPSFGLDTGTGTNCGSSTATLITAFSTPAASIFAFAPLVGVTPASSELCYHDTGTSPVQNYTISYVQQ